MHKNDVKILFENDDMRQGKSQYIQNEQLSKRSAHLLHDINKTQKYSMKAKQNIKQNYKGLRSKSKRIEWENMKRLLTHTHDTFLEQFVFLLFSLFVCCSVRFLFSVLFQSAEYTSTLINVILLLSILFSVVFVCDAIYLGLCNVFFPYFHCVHRIWFLVFRIDTYGKPLRLFSFWLFR